MSSQRGNPTRTRPQKNQNDRAFKKDLYGTTPQTKFLDSFKMEGLCSRCTRVIEWKLKYKKYKRLTTPGKCIRCVQKAVREAYHNMCRPCAEAEGKCPKCCQPLSADCGEAPPAAPGSDCASLDRRKEGSLNVPRAGQESSRDVSPEEEGTDSDFSGDEDDGDVSENEEA